MVADAIIGIIVLIVAGKLIYSDSQKGFVNKAAKKGWVSRGKLIRTYTDDGKYYGTYEYEADGDVYTLEVEYNINLYKEDPPNYMGIYYKGSNPRKACIREKSAKQELKQNWKKAVMFCMVMGLVAAFWYIRALD